MWADLKVSMKHIHNYRHLYTDISVYLIYTNFSNHPLTFLKSLQTLNDSNNCTKLKIKLK